MPYATMDDWKTAFINRYPTSNDFIGFNDTNASTGGDLSNRYAFTLGYTLKACIDMMPCSKDTFWADRAKDVIDQMLSQRDELTDPNNPYAPGGPNAWRYGGPEDGVTGCPVWHRQATVAGECCDRALLLDNGIIICAMMQYVDAVRSYSEFSSYVTHSDTVMDRVQETVDAFNYPGYSDWTYISPTEGHYRYPRAGSQGWYSAEPEINHQAQFLSAQLLLHKYRPGVGNNADIINQAIGYKNHWFNHVHIFPIPNAPPERYDWPYSLSNLTQTPQADDCHTVPEVYCSEDLGHSAHTIEFPWHAWDVGGDGVILTQTEIDRFAKTYTTGIYLGNGEQSSTANNGGPPGHIDGGSKVIAQFGVAGYHRLQGLDSNHAVYGRDVFETQWTGSLLHPKQEWQISGLLLAENPPGGGSPDTTNPICTITSPADMSSESSNPVTVTGTSSDPGSPASGVNTVEVSVQGGAWQTANTSDAWANWTLDVTLAGGSNTIDARAFDVAGNESPTDTITVTFNPPDTTNPVVNIVSPADLATVTTAMQTVTGTASDPGSPSSGVDRVEVQVNGGVWLLASTSDAWANWSRSITLISGSNTINARSIDVAGNTSTLDTHTVTLSADSTPPTVAISTPTEGVTQFAGAVTVTGTASDADSGVSYVEVRVDSSNDLHWVIASGTTSWTITVPIGAGATTIEARAFDNEGNVSSIATRNLTSRAKKSGLIFGG